MIKTTWGYEVTSADELPAMLSGSGFDAITANKYAGDIRISPELNAASMAIRNYCGWHLYPFESCRFEVTMRNARVSRCGVDISVQLPAKYVTEVTSVQIGGQDYDFTFEVGGKVYIYDVLKSHGRKDMICIEYGAGLPDALMGSIAELIAHQSTHALASSYGVTNETAGGVSITYNAAWQNNTRASSLSESDRFVLEPYRCQGVF